MKKTITLLLLTLMMSGLFITTASAEEAELTEAIVVEVIDGDTIVLDNGERVRLIGIDTPEIGSDGAEEATKFTSSYVLNQTVWLERDGENRDPYGRLRRYVWLEQPTDVTDETQIRANMLNAMLLEHDHAVTLFVGDVRNETLFRIIAREPGIPPTYITPPPQSEPFNGLTPNGTATVVDNATDANGIEFFTFETENGNVFYLIVDRNSSTNNVHFLNAVTEWDLMALAQGTSQPQQTTPPQNKHSEDEPDVDTISDSPLEDSTATTADALNSNSTIIFIVIAVVVFGALAYYFKIVKKKQDDNFDDEEDDYFDNENSDNNDYFDDNNNDDYDE